AEPPDTDSAKAVLWGGGSIRTATPDPACSRWLGPPRLMLRADHRAAVHLVGHVQGDLSIRERRGDVVIREQLVRRVPGFERDLDLDPEWIESITLNRVEHAHEWLATGKARVGHVDRVDRLVAEQRR